MENTIELLQRWHRGEDLALHELLARFLPALRDRAKNLLARHPGQRALQDSSDLVQDAAVRVLRYGPRFLPRDDKQFLALVVRFMRNALLNRVRSPDGAPRPSPSVLDLRADSDSDFQPHRAVEVEEARAWARMALELLPDDERELFRLRFTEDASWDEIGHALDLEPGTARMRFERAKPRVANLVRRLQSGQLQALLDSLPES